MIATTPKLRSPLKWHGGKSYLARRIVGLFPEHETYVEPFLGGGSVLLNKPRSEVEVAGDLCGPLVRMWRGLRDLGPWVTNLLKATEYSELSWQTARGTAGCAGEVEHAWAFIVANRMSRGGLGKNFAWSERLRGRLSESGPVPGDVNAWDTFRAAHLPAVISRLAHVRFRNQCALATMFYHDAPGTLVYLDPPYLHETRTSKAAYQFEMTRSDHEALLAAANASRSRVFLSGYRSDLYDAALAGWTRHDFDMPNHSGQGKTKQRRTECLWENPA